MKTMQQKVAFAAGLGFLVGLAPMASAALSARQIMEKNEEVRKLVDVTSTATLSTGGGGAPDRVKKFTWWRKLSSDGIHNKTLTRFHEPAEVRGQGILMLENPSGENDVQMYLPAYKKIRRVESQQQSGSFMGSEFSYSDMTTPHVEEYEHKLLPEEVCPGEAAVRCFVVEAKPNSDRTRERTGHSKVTSWIRVDNFMGVQSEYVDLEGALVKRLKAAKIEKIDAKNGKWMALDVRMENLKTGRFTHLEFASVKANTGIQDALFTAQNLQKER